jgi:hypothetical protein
VGTAHHPTPAADDQSHPYFSPFTSIRNQPLPLPFRKISLSHLTKHKHTVKTTRYFEEQVLPRRPYIQREWCELAIQNPVKREIQPDGRIRYWCYVEELETNALPITSLVMANQ